MATIARGDGKSIEYQNGSTALTSGQVVELNSTDSFVGVVISDIPANAVGALSIDGVFEFTKNQATDVIATGDPIAIAVVSNNAVVAVSAGEQHVAVSESANGDTTVMVKINVH